MSSVPSAAAALLCAAAVLLSSRSEAGRSARLDAATYLAPAVPRDGPPEPAGAAAARAMRRGPLPADADALEGAKAAADEAVPDEVLPDEVTVGEAVDGEAVGGTLGVSPAPQARPSWKGIAQAGGAPSDSTGAIGATRYIEVVNSRVAVYDRAGIRLASASLAGWWGAGTAANTFDPQVIWDAGTERFYYAGDAVFGDADHELAFGWSTGASPGLGAADWCRYTVKYGTEFPDYPKLVSVRRRASGPPAPDVANHPGCGVGVKRARGGAGLSSREA